MLDATALAEAVRRRDVAPVELVEETFRRIEATDGQLNAFVTLCHEQALTAARGPLPAGPFAGVPIGIKDLTDVAGVPTRTHRVRSRTTSRLPMPRLFGA